MSHTYPLAKSAKDALNAGLKTARTRYEAEEKAEGMVVKSLETEWLTPAAQDTQALIAKIEASNAHGFVQHYEDATGNTVLAVTYWKIGKITARKSAKPTSISTETETEDHTDDLYFRSGRTRKSRKSKAADPNQMDLFGKKNSIP